MRLAFKLHNIQANGTCLLGMAAGYHSKFKFFPTQGLIHTSMNMFERILTFKDLSKISGRFDLPCFKRALLL